MLVSNITRNFAVLALSAAASFGAAPVARVIGAQPMEVDGISVPQGNYTPISLGSEVKTAGGVAVVQFRDGSNVALEPNSLLRLEGNASDPAVHIVRGTAAYTVSSRSHLRIVDSKGETLNRILDHALPQATANMQRGIQMDAAVMYRNGSRLPGGIAPASAIAVGQFTGTGVFHASGGPGGSAQIITPSGLTINVSQSTNAAGQTVYTITSITETVTTPTGGTATVSVTSGSLIGASVSGFDANTSTGTNVAISITPAGSSTPLNPTQAGQQIQQGVQNAVNQGVQSGQLPAGTTAPSNPSPVTTGQFSSSAP